MSERVSLSKNVKYGGLHGPTIRVRDGYSNELWNKVQVWKASMPEAEWKAKIDLYYNSDFCVLKGYGLTREQIFSEPWEVGIARFGMQTLKQATDLTMPYSYGEADKPKTWLYAWVRK